MPAAEEHFRRAIPKRDHFVRVSSQGNTKCASETKVSKLQIALLVDEKVLWLQISVQDTMSMAVVDAANQLVGEFLKANAVSSAL